MPDLDLSALRKVAEAANRGIYSSWGDAEDFDATFNPDRILALLDELERLQREARGPKFSERLAMAQQAWDEYRPVAKLTEPQPPTLFSAGYTMGISHGYQRRHP